MKAALYERISQDRTGEGLAVTRQHEDNLELANQLGWEVVDTYRDEAKSATSGKRRPEYLRMLADIEAGKINAVIAWHPDRLYRVLPDLAELAEVCKRNNVAIATVRSGTVDLTTPSGRMIAGMLGLVATYEGEAKSDRWKRSVRQSREAGHFPPSGPRMFGYTRDGQIVEEEAEHVRWMAAEIVTGRSIQGLARDLNQRGVPTSTGKAWQHQTIKGLLTNPKTAGLVKLNGDIIGEGTWVPLLDRDMWETVRAVIAVNGGRAPALRVALLPGLLYCGAPGCGARMGTGSRMSRKGQLVRTYRCLKTPGKEGCGTVSGTAEAIEDIVEAYAQELWKNPAVQARVAQLRGQPTGVLVELAEYEARVLELEGQLDVPGVPVETIMRAIDRAKERVEALSAQLAHATPVKPPKPGEWPEDLARRRQMVETVVERVTLMPATKPSASFDVTRVKIKRRVYSSAG